MAKKNKIEIDVHADDDGTLKKVGVESKKAAKGMDDLGNKSNNARRNMGGAADMSNRGVKSFSKMQQGVGGLVGVYATLAAQVFAVSAAFQFLKSASDVVNLIAGQEALGAVSGVAYKTITASIKEATGGQIAYADAAKAAAIGTAAGLSPEQLNRLGAAAKNVSHALGRDLTDSFNRLVRGITKAEPELLDELGIILRLDDATQKYADSLGLDANKLSVFQKSQAVANETLSQAEEKFGAINEIMDPSAASLNKFLVSFDDLMNSIKTGAMKGIRPVFDFLAGNTRALTAALSLMALPIIKSLIPSFENWGKKVNKSLEGQRDNLKDYRGEIDKTKDAIAMMGRDSASIGKSSAGVLGSLGKDTTSASKGSGAAFLLGTSDTKAAQNNARKILDNAQAQMREHNAVLTGYLQGATAEQLALLETNYAQRKALLKKHEIEHGNSWKKLGLHVKFWAQEAKLAIMSVGTAMVSFVGNIGTHLAKLFSIGMWVSLGAIVGEILLGWLDKLYPIGEEAEKLREKVTKLEDSNKTLNEELQKMTEIQPFITLAMEVEQLGKAFTSTNIIAKLTELQALQSGSAPQLTAGEQFTKELAQAIIDIDKWIGGAEDSPLNRFFENQNYDIPVISTALDAIQEKVEEVAAKGDEPFKTIEDGFLVMLKTIAKLNPEMDKFVTLFEKNGRLSKEEKNQLSAIEQKWINYGIGVSKAKDAVKEFNDELKNLMGDGLELDPTVAARRAGEKAIELQADAVLGLQETQKKNIILANKDFQKMLDAQAKSWEFRNKYGRGSGFSGMKTVTPAILDQQDPTGELTKEWTKLNEKIADAKTTAGDWTEKIKEGKEAVENAVTEATRLRITQEGLNNLADDLLPKIEDRLKFEKKALKNKKLGITIEDKLSNLEAAALGRKAKSMKLDEDLTRAKGLETTKQAIYDKTKLAVDKEQLDNAKNAVKFAQHKVDLDEEQVRLAREKETIDRIRLQFARAQAVVLSKQTAMVKAEIAENSRRRIEDAGLDGGGRNTVQLGLEKRLRTIQEIEGENGKIAQQIKAEELANVALGKARATNDEVGIEKAKRDIVLAKEKKKVLEDQLRIAKEFNQIQVNAMKNEEADAAKALGELSLDPRKQAQKQALGRLDKNATDEQKKEAIKAASATFDLNLQLEETSALYGTIQTSMTDAFADMIMGAKSAKEAFASMAKSMLAELAKIIAKRLMLKALGALGFADGGITPKLKGRSYTVGGVARGPSSGYQATLHGNEAVVPLPSGGAIPVQGTGLGGGTNNVTVNVNVDNNGNASSESQGQGMGQDLGKVVAKAVQEELQYQKRSGGILNPYGAA